MAWQDEFRAKLMSPEDAAQLLRSGDVLRSGIGADARSLLPALFNRVLELDKNVKIIRVLAQPLAGVVHRRLRRPGLRPVVGGLRRRDRPPGARRESR